MSKRKINFIKRYSPDGTVYNQGVNITKKEYDQLLDCLECEKHNPTNKDHYFQLYLKQPIRINKPWNNIIFTNLTQRDYFNKFLKAKLLDRNTCFIIN